MRLITPSEVIETFKEARSLAVVGNAPTVKDHSHGSLIDGHDIIVRFNRIKTDGLEESIGSRTDILCVNAANSLAKAPPPAVASRPKLLVCFVSPQGCRHADFSTFAEWVGEMPILLTFGPDLIGLRPALHTRPLTSGTYLLFMLLRLLEIERLFVTGFTMFGAVAGGSAKVYDDSNSGVGIYHDIDQEAKIFAETLAQFEGQLTMTPEVESLVSRYGARKGKPIVNVGPGMADRESLTRRMAQAVSWRLGECGNGTPAVWGGVAVIATMMTCEPPEIGGQNVERWFHRVLEQEAASLAEVSERLRVDGQNVAFACKLIQESRQESNKGRRVIVSGVGKAGLIGRKVAATLSSTGTPALFVHPVEALHGDLGGVCAKDCGLLFSYSGESVEVVRLAEELRRMRCPIAAVTRSKNTGLGQRADVVIETGDIREACDLGLAPSSSTTVMLAIGDALALAVAKANRFSEKEFAVNHPAGLLGLRFRKVSEFMRTNNRLVCVKPSTTIQEVVRQVSSAKTGAAIVVEENGTLGGIFTDGDLRRALLKGGDVLSLPVGCFSTFPCKYVASESCVADAWNAMLETRIEDLPVVDHNNGLVIGLLCLKDIKW